MTCQYLFIFSNYTGQVLPAGNYTLKLTVISEFVEFIIR